MVTRGILQEELKNYPTKKELKEELATLEGRINNNTDSKLEKLMYKIADMFTQLRSDFYAKVDPFLREIEDARLDRETNRLDLLEISSILKDHEKRITSLERKN